MALINADPSNTHKEGNLSQSKGVTTRSTKAVIYLITCPCGKNDVGKTKRELKVRISEHRSTIRCKNFTYPVVVHFMESNDLPSLRPQARLAW